MHLYALLQHFADDMKSVLSGLFGEHAGDFLFYWKSLKAFSQYYCTTKRLYSWHAVALLPWSQHHTICNVTQFLVPRILQYSRKITELDPPADADKITWPLPMSKCNLLFATLLFVFFAAVACFYAYLIIFQAMFFVNTINWKTANATVTYLRLTTSYTGDGLLNFYCHVRYNYTVNGETYKGRRAGIYSVTGGKSLCYYLDKKRGRNEIHCYYNPNAPAESTLNKQFSSLHVSLYLVVFFGFATMGFGGLAGLCLRPCLSYTHYELYAVPAFFAFLSSVASFVTSVYALNRGDLSAIAILVLGIVFLMLSAYTSCVAYEAIRQAFNIQGILPVANSSIV